MADEKIDSQVRLVGKKKMWPWLVPLLLLLLVGGYILANKIDEVDVINDVNTNGNANLQAQVPTPEATTDASSNANTNSDTGAVITNVAELSGASSLANRQFNLNKVTVQRVVGDKVFYIATAETTPALVYLDSQLDDKASTEQSVVVKANQSYALQGTVQPLPQASELKGWGLTDADIQALSSQNTYLRASQVTNTQ